MARKIQFNIIQSLFRLFSFLADKTGGWNIFVKPKLLLGTMILGLFSAGVTITSCSPEEPICYDPSPTCYDVAVEEPFCYRPPAPEEEVPLCYAPPAPKSSDTSTTE